MIFSITDYMPIFEVTVWLLEDIQFLQVSLFLSLPMKNIWKPGYKNCRCFAEQNVQLSAICPQIFRFFFCFVFGLFRLALLKIARLIIARENVSNSSPSAPVKTKIAQSAPQPKKFFQLKHVSEWPQHDCNFVFILSSILSSYNKQPLDLSKVSWK